MARRGILLVVGLAATFAFAVATSPAAGAHGGPPRFTVEAAQPAETSVHYVIRMVYANDGDPITGRVVTVTPVSPSGVAGTTVTLSPLDDGRYEGPVEMPEPGAWTVTIASPDPEGSMSVTEVRPEPPATTAPPPPTTEPPVDDAVVDEPDGEDEVDPVDESAAAADTNDAGDDDSPVALIIFGAVAVLVAAGIVAAVLRRNKTASGDTPA